LKETVYFSLGSNLGDRLGNLETSLDLLSRLCRDLESSRIYETEPLHFRRQPKFLNLAARGTYAVTPERLLARIQGIEHRLGRVRERRFGPRTIDIDILLYGRLVRSTETLTLPHPRLGVRRFVLIPLLELEPKLADPESGEPYWKSLIACPPGGVYFHALSRYTVRSLVPLGGRAYSG
jgi:2-amino-4-hydroxy-6-hydroxymethyldihydropteridine diphosphokinase